jgi:hypothetical protein
VVPQDLRHERTGGDEVASLVQAVLRLLHEVMGAVWCGGYDERVWMAHPAGLEGRVADARQLRGEPGDPPGGYPPRSSEAPADTLVARSASSLRS